MAGNSGGPWGGGGNSGGDDERPNRGQNGGGNRPNRPGEEGPQIPEIDELMKKGQEQLRVLMGGRGGGGGRQNGGGEGGGGAGFEFTKGTIGLVAVAAVVLWGFASFYRVDTSEQSVELLFGERYGIGTEGLNFAPWPFVTKEIIGVTSEHIEDIGVATGNSRDAGLMLTGDENIVDIDFQVVWNINDPEKFLFNIAEPKATIRAVSESVMREIVARTDLTPILTTGKGKIAGELKLLIQQTLDSYESGINIVRVNFDKADPPHLVADSFREVQAAEQRRDTLEKQADAYANQVVAEARGQSAQLIAAAQGYSAQVVNQAEGEASRFTAVLAEYQRAPEVTRKRLYIETMEEVFGNVDKIILDSNASGGQGVVPYLPLNELRRSSGGSN